VKTAFRAVLEHIKYLIDTCKNPFFLVAKDRAFSTLQDWGLSVGNHLLLHRYHFIGPPVIQPLLKTTLSKQLMYFLVPWVDP